MLRYRRKNNGSSIVGAVVVLRNGQNYSDEELEAMQHQARLLRDEGYGSDAEYQLWLYSQK